MDPGQALQSNMERMRQAAHARRNRPLQTMVSTTGAAPASKPSTANSTTTTTTTSSGLPNSPSLGSGPNPFPSSTASTSIPTPTNPTTPNTTSTAATDAETQAQEKLRKRLESVGIAPTVEAAGERERQAEPRRDVPKLDVTDTKSFLSHPPPPQHGLVLCYITREKSGNRYNMYMEDKHIFLLASTKRKSKTSNYLISLDKDDLHRNSGNFYGKLRANFVGTEFIIYDKGEKPTKEGLSSGLHLRQELGAVLYERNILGSKGPRKMTALLPAVDEQTNRRTVWRPDKEEDGLIAQYKKGNTEGMVTLRNKEPAWNEQLRAYVLNFNGRVTLASVKNFQLVDPSDPSKVVMQFGKINENKFTLDYQYPVSGLQAFGIALSAFDGKLVCE
eukprot:TRINITY_DN75306_c0_g1_i1.p1 TRINITY_DN75306_c0_g1~~TRINITY_DN75306_c0_g1_i1.p1  ORF type:complete len:389 (-),score=34.25 TRINITY_DN75306_c0_g1_i1:113-1279(-)